MKTKLEEAAISCRQTGSTTWILKSAIKRPNCIIVSRNMETALHLDYAYSKLLNEQPWYKKLRWKICGRKNPKFVSIDYNFRANRLPVIFDNSALL